MNRPKSCEDCCRFSHCNNNDLYCLSVARYLINSQKEQTDYYWHKMKAPEGCVYECMCCKRKVTEGIGRKKPIMEEIRGDNTFTGRYISSIPDFFCRACAYNYRIEVEE